MPVQVRWTCRTCMLSAMIIMDAYIVAWMGMAHACHPHRLITIHRRDFGPLVITGYLIICNKEWNYLKRLYWFKFDTKKLLIRFLLIKFLIIPFIYLCSFYHPKNIFYNRKKKLVCLPGASCIMRTIHGMADVACNSHGCIRGGWMVETPHLCRPL